MLKLLYTFTFLFNFEFLFENYTFFKNFKNNSQTKQVISYLLKQHFETVTFGFSVISTQAYIYFFLDIF